MTQAEYLQGEAKRVETYTYDDGSSLSFDGQKWSATPIEATNIIQQSTGDGSYLSILDDFAGAITKVGTTIGALQTQQQNMQRAGAANELERYKTLAMLNIGKSQADVASINAQRDVALAKLNLSSLSGGSSMLLILAIAAAAFMVMNK